MFRHHAVQQYLLLRLLDSCAAAITVADLQSTISSSVLTAVRYGTEEPPPCRQAGSIHDRVCHN